MIAGYMRLYRGSWLTIQYALPSLLRLCDRLYLQLHHTEIPQGFKLPSDVKIGHYNKPNHDKEAQLNGLVELVRDDNPSWVLIPDSDEILPEWVFPQVLQDAEAKGYWAIEFPYRQPWNGFQQQADPSEIHTGYHVKALRWAADMNFIGGGGFCKAAGKWQKIVHCSEPLLHLLTLNPEIREMRKQTGRVCPFGPQSLPYPTELVPLEEKWFAIPEIKQALAEQGV